jgi:hypothetical protein
MAVLGPGGMSINALARAMRRSTLVRLAHSHTRTACPDHDIQATGNPTTLRGRGDGKHCHPHIVLRRLLFQPLPTHSDRAHNVDTRTVWNGGPTRDKPEVSLG